ncbi:MAG: formate transporter FocA [Bacteroidota bacterium]
MNYKPDISALDTLLPPEMAQAAVETGVTKAHTGFVKVFALAVLAGAFIAFGAVFSTVVTSGSTLSFGVTKLLSGVSFSLGLILVVVGGAELFTGNNLLIMAWTSRKISTGLVLRNWGIVYLGNMLGAFSVVLMIGLSGHYLFGDGLIGSNMLGIAEAKCEFGFTQALFLGILCNILVCLAIWLCYSAKTTHGRILAIIFPITAFVAAGFEHSVANMYFIPMGLWVKEWSDPQIWSMLHKLPGQFESLTWGNYLIRNLLPVTLGNIIGGSLFVGLAYWFIYSSKWTLKTV